MPLSRQEFNDFIKDFNFPSLFNEMGWDRDATEATVKVGDHSYVLKSAGQKSGFKILVCSPDPLGKVPDSATRKKIETQAKKRFEEHLIIFHDTAKSEQLWQYVSKQTNGPRRLADTRWNKSQSPELLFQRAAGVYFEIDEEENITIVDVTQRIAANFDQNNERVTKKFYDQFKKEHSTFYDFLSGIDDHIDEWNKTHKKDKKENLNKQWYVSLMLNRLMFCYFIQKKGFLDKNKNYLYEKLTESRQKRGRNKYYSFYRDFLLALFHSGLGAPKHSTELKAEIGRIPYLNGGLFDEHQLERDFSGIEIKDEAFEKVFEFFDKYEWHLDTRHAASGRDVNPDVIGYIFEKYINDRAAMGAYYTKEDITEYISKNCILPFVFDEVKRNYPSAFKPGGEIWKSLRESGDKYIYHAVKKGVELELPENIVVGLDTKAADLLERRKDWNKKAHEGHALPTEIWREVVDRRRRYSEAKEKIENGEITEINDFITYNLNIRQFAQDAIENSTDPKFVEHFYKAISSVTILDPTCGSGAFLFAAMNILEPLYGEALRRMRNFVEDEDRTNTGDKKNFSNKHQFFRGVLEQVQNPSHPNQQYFVYKSIILNNLYGVDIMKEAVEVAKLRLFLKLVATVDADYSKPNLGLEPLPDIDFNIRAGNTLIGYVSQSQIDNLAALLISAKDKEKVVEECDVVARAFRRFKECQLDQENDFASFKKAKDELQTRMQKLNSTLDRTLYKEYYEGQDYDSWKRTHQPFHWVSEFYEIVSRGGFEVVIGNPPYVEYNKVRGTYSVIGYESEPTGNLYAYVCERAADILTNSGRTGFIVPISVVSVSEAETLRNFLSTAYSTMWVSSYAIRPAKLFDGVEQRLSILISKAQTNAENEWFSTKYYQWYVGERPDLFRRIEYSPIEIDNGSPIPKISTAKETSIIEKVNKSGLRQAGNYLFRGDGHQLFFHRTPGYWIRMMDFEPYFKSPTQSRSIHHIRELHFHDAAYSAFVGALGNSSMFFFWFFAMGNCRNLTLDDVKTFPIGEPSTDHLKMISMLFGSLMSNFDDNSTIRSRGETNFQEFNWSLAKPIIDEIDKVLAKHYGFTDEELDFIINYDIKYRMGSELDSDEPSAEETGKSMKNEMTPPKPSKSEGNILLSGGPLFD